MNIERPNFLAVPYRKMSFVKRLLVRIALGNIESLKIPSSILIPGGTHQKFDDDAEALRAKAFYFFFRQHLIKTSLKFYSASLAVSAILLFFVQAAK